jgi:2'-5' RNA ligase
MRLFIAVNFDTRIRGLIAQAIDRFPLERPPWRWTKPDTWHVTLKFLGEPPEAGVAPLHSCLAGVAALHPAFEVTLREFGGFPSLRRPRVLFYGVDRGAAALRDLAADVEQTLLDEMGVPKDSKRFHAHATVARVKSTLPGPVIDGLTSVPPLEGAVQTVGSIDLMKSELHPQGARYECLKAFALPPAP